MEEIVKETMEEMMEGNQETVDLRKIVLANDIPATVTDPIVILNHWMDLPEIHMHGPEHHTLDGAALLVALDHWFALNPERASELNSLRQERADKINEIFSTAETNNILPRNTALDVFDTEGTEVPDSKQSDPKREDLTNSAVTETETETETETATESEEPYRVDVAMDLPTAIDWLIDRAGEYPGGACGSVGVCGAAVSCGAAFSIFSVNTPFSEQTWSQNAELTSRIIGNLASTSGPRCCKRNAYFALETTAKFLKEKYKIDLQMNHEIKCHYFDKNEECLYAECPFF